MNRVPVEILSKIFVHYAEDQGQYPPGRVEQLPIWDVCRQWRYIASKTPFLGSAVLDLSSAEAEIRSVIQENPLSYLKVKMPGVMFRPNADAEVLKTAGQTMLEVQSKMARLEIDWIAIANRMTLPEFFNEYLGELKGPRLRFMRLSHTVIGDFATPEITLGPNLTDELEYLEVQLIQWHPPIQQLPNLTTLKIGLARGTLLYDLSSLTATLGACPHLQYFTLNGRAARGTFLTESPTPIPPVQLSELKEFSITYFTCNQIDEIFARVEIPRSARTNVRCIKTAPDDEVQCPQALATYFNEASTCRIVANGSEYIHHSAPFIDINYSTEDGPAHSLTFAFLETHHIDDYGHIMRTLHSLPLSSLEYLDLNCSRLPSDREWTSFLQTTPDLVHIGIHGGDGVGLVHALKQLVEGAPLCPDLRSLDFAGSHYHSYGTRVDLHTLHELIEIRRQERVPIHSLAIFIHDPEVNVKGNRIANFAESQASEVTLDIIRRIEEAKRKADEKEADRRQKLLNRASQYPGWSFNNFLDS
ncbi:hypothetical protein SISSUDRAFT_1117353 [Sistotremastrum suecicum HHB10207 ss-3]|uniref:Uncharacterized protein n=1 Tax=Sistotremastrum suecicum HHB10207 ss-3 TaxID=1314776 RepID=A0A166GS16_9AGAM|nr:hypothetical protein SISSUDRAFT_1117353 [Sistotremastrum suecicum HHB10207 ss-3]